MKPFPLHPLPLAASLLFFVVPMTVKAQNNCSDNPYLGPNGLLHSELEFRDGQAGFVGVSGTSWIILPGGTLQSSSFINDELSAPQQRCQLSQQEILSLAHTLSAQNFAALPAQIPAEPSLNTRRLTVRFGNQSSSLELKTVQSIDQALSLETKQPDSVRLRFLTIAKAIEKLIARCAGT